MNPKGKTRDLYLLLLSKIDAKIPSQNPKIGAKSLPSVVYALYYQSYCIFRNIVTATL